MQITDQQWNEIVAETKAGIDRWNARAAERGKSDRFAATLEPTSAGYSVLITTHSPDGERHAVARSATGELRSCRMKRRRTGWQIAVKTPDPKSWAKLANKPAGKIVDALGLLNFVLFLGSEFLGTSTTRSRVVPAAE